MEITSKSRSVFTILFLRIAITILVLNSILAIINIRDAISIQEKSDEALRNKIIIVKINVIIRIRFALF